MFSGMPEGIRQAAGHGLFESSLLLPHKIRAKQKGVVAHPLKKKDRSKSQKRLRSFALSLIVVSRKTQKQEQHIEILEKSQQLKFRMPTEIRISKHNALYQASNGSTPLSSTCAAYSRHSQEEGTGRFPGHSWRTSP